MMIVLIVLIVSAKPVRRAGHWAGLGLPTYCIILIRVGPNYTRNVGSVHFEVNVSALNSSPHLPHPDKEKTMRAVKLHVMCTGLPC